MFLSFLITLPSMIIRLWKDIGLFYKQMSSLRIEQLKAERKGMETEKNVYPKETFAYERRDLGVAICDLKINILEAFWGKGETISERKDQQR